MAEADNIMQICERFNSTVRYDTRETHVSNRYFEPPKQVAHNKALELAALLSVISCEPENVTSLTDKLRCAFFDHLNDLGQQVLALTELVAEQ